MEYRGEIIPITEGIRQEVLAEVGQLNRQGLRVLGVGYKSGLREDYAYAVTDESDMILTGYLAFLDPPKGCAQRPNQPFHKWLGLLFRYPQLKFLF